MSNEHNNAPAVPQGWKLVPVEPTPEMIRCAEMWEDGFDGAYARALAATPAPAPAQEPVTLTDDELIDAWNSVEPGPDSTENVIVLRMRAIIAALRAKGGK